MATPWKSLSKITSVAAAGGDQFLLASDSSWLVAGDYGFNLPGTWTGTKENPVIIGKYDPVYPTTNKPLIEKYTSFVAGDWTYDAPNNAWYATLASAVGGLDLVYIDDSWVANATDANTLPIDSVYGRYQWTGSRLYIYAPSGTNPATYYRSVLYSSAISTTLFTLNGTCGFIKFQDLRFNKSAGCIMVYSGGATPVGAIIERCDGTLVSSVFRTYSDHFGYTDTIIRQCTINGFGSAGTSHGSFGDSVYHAVDIYDNSINDGPHCFVQGGNYFQCGSTAARNRVHNNTYESIRFGNVGKSTDGCAVYAEEGTRLLYTYSNLITNSCNAFMDNSGRQNFWYNNVVLNCRSAMVLSDGGNIGTTDFYFINNTCQVGGGIPPEAGDNVRARGVEVYKDVGLVLTAVRIQNNVFWNIGTTWPAAIYTAQVNTTTQTFDANAYTTGTYTDLARREFAPFTVESATNTLTPADLFLDAFGKLESGSPLIGTGTKVAGTTPKRDFDLVQRRKTPSIGAYDVAQMRAAMT
jgi:hypothetical protein